jgi:uncharacterized SAM-binding protein YcdF (DUF218 family)
MRGILVSLALPPMGFVVLIGIGLLARGRWRRFGTWLTWGSLIALFLLAMPVVSYPMLLALETGFPTVPPAGHPPQAIVILGGDVIRAHQEASGVRPGLLTLDRLRTGAALHRRTGLPILVTGGTTQPDTEPVGKVMETSLRDDFQVLAQWTETKSRDTRENALFSAAILKREGISSVYVVTHSWHMRRAMLSFARTGLIATAAPTSLDDPMGPNWGDLVPRSPVWQTCWFAMHEWIGYVWYRLH